MPEESHGMFHTLGIILSTVVITILIELVLIIGFLWVKNPFGVKDYILNTTQSGTSTASSTVKVNNPFLSADQNNLLRSVGVDPSTLPTTLTPELLNCANTALGAERLDALKKGATPTLADVLKAKKCLPTK